MSNSDFNPNDPEVVLDPFAEAGQPPPPATGIEPQGLDYWYFQVPKSITNPTGDLLNTSLVLVDRFLQQFNMVCARKDLVDGSRVYRIESRDLTRFPKDGGGYYAVGQVQPGIGQPKYRIVNTDPGAGLLALKDWTPVTQ